MLSFHHFLSTFLLIQLIQQTSVELDLFVWLLEFKFIFAPYFLINNFTVLSLFLSRSWRIKQNGSMWSIRTNYKVNHKQLIFDERIEHIFEIADICTDDDDDGNDDEVAYFPVISNWIIEHSLWFWIFLISLFLQTLISGVCHGLEKKNPVIFIGNALIWVYIHWSSKLFTGFYFTHGHSLKRN